MGRSRELFPGQVFTAERSQRFDTADSSFREVRTETRGADIKHSPADLRAAPQRIKTNHIFDLPNAFIPALCERGTLRGDSSLSHLTVTL